MIIIIFSIEIIAKSHIFLGWSLKKFPFFSYILNIDNIEMHQYIHTVQVIRSRQIVTQLQAHTSQLQSQLQDIYDSS